MLSSADSITEDNRTSNGKLHLLTSQTVTVNYDFGCHYSRNVVKHVENRLVPPIR